MSELVAECSRCGAQQITFELLAAIKIGSEYGWQGWHEAFCQCRHCGRTSTFVLAESDPKVGDVIRKHGLEGYPGAVNGLVDIKGIISIKDTGARISPEHLPKRIEAAFDEGARCLVIRCPNAASAMFRLCVDLATIKLVPAEAEGGPDSVTRRNLARRLGWLFEKGLLPEGLRELSTCIREDGNDGAHVGNLKVEDAEDIGDFLEALLDRLFTEPERLRLAKERREARRAQGPQGGENR
jgi:hypothetical protein